MSTFTHRRFSILAVTALLLIVALLLVNCGGGGGGGATSPAPTYTVRYSGNGNTSGSVPTDPTNYEYGQTVTVLGNTGNLEKTGYSFSGWNTMPDGTGTTYAQAQTFTMGSATVILYAKWTANATYAVTYNGNGSDRRTTPPIDDTNYEPGQTVTVLGNTGNLTKSGYSFTGWNTEANGTGTTYLQGQTFLMASADVTLYAKWTANPTYTVTYDGNGNTGGSVPTDSTNYEAGKAVTVPGNSGNLVKSGYSFTGWNTQANGTGTTYTQSQTFSIGAANVTLYARWTTNPTYTVTYDGNGKTGGSVPVDSTSYEVGQTVTVLRNTGNLVKSGYSFIGWNTQANGTGTTYTQAQPFAMGSANVILYAQWTANPTYTVTYDGNGKTSGNVPVDSTNYEVGQTVTVPGNTGNLIKTGYSFIGWNTQANGNGTTYTQSQTFSIGAANITLYAKWTVNPTYTVTYDGNGSTGGIVPVDSTTYETGKSVTILGNTGILVKSGSAFVGWNTLANGTGTTYTQAQTLVMGSANVILYAKWTVNPTYTVTYDGNGKTGGSVPTDNTKYEVNQTVTVLGNTGNLVKTGFVFAGWNTLADGTGTAYGASFTMGAVNVTLYAKWTAVWTGVKQLGVAGEKTRTNSVAVDGSGNVYVAGYTYGGLGGTLTGIDDCFLTMYDSTGNIVRSRQLGAAGAYTEAYGVAVDGSGNVYVAGYTDGGLPGNISNTGLSDSFLAKYDSAGNLMYTKQLGAAGAYTWANSAAVDGSGNVYVAGYTDGDLNGTLTGVADFFLAKYDSTGNIVRTIQLGATGAYTEAYGVAVDGSGNVYVSGYTDGGLSGNTGSTGLSDSFLTKYTSAGAWQYTKQLGVANAYTWANSVAVNRSGNAYVAGYTDGVLNGTLTGTADFFVATYDASGNVALTRQLGATGKYTEAFGVAVDGSSNVYVAGYTNGGLSGTVNGVEDYFLTAYDPTGSIKYTRQLGTTGAYTEAFGLVVDGSSNVYVAGYTDGGLDGNNLTGTFDGFVAKYDPAGTKQ